MKVIELKCVISSEDIVIKEKTENTEYFERNERSKNNEYFEVGNHSKSLWDEYGESEIERIYAGDDWRIYIDIK